MTPIHWRKAEAKDADKLSLLGQATFLNTFAFDHPGDALVGFLQNEHSVDYYRARLADPVVDIILGETPLGAPVSYAMLCAPELSDHARKGDWELKRIYLLPGWQGGGNGSALMQQVLAAAQARGAQRLLLAVYESNVSAQGYYAHLGFERIGETTFMVGEVPFRDLVFARQL